MVHFIGAPPPRPLVPVVSSKHFASSYATFPPAGWRSDARRFGADAHESHLDLFVEPRDVLGERALQETVILRDEGDLATEALSVPARERPAVDVDIPVARLVEPRDDLDERGLTATGVDADRPGRHSMNGQLNDAVTDQRQAKDRP